MLFIDAMYILCCNFYKKREANIFKVSGLILLGFVFLTNTMLIGYMLPSVFSKRFEIDYVYNNGYYIIFGSEFLFLIVLYLRYFKITNYDEVVNKMYSLTPTKRNIYSITALVYILISIGLFITYVIYKGGIKSGWW